MIEVNVLGLGYIGLPTAAILCSSGYKVNGVDINKVVLERLIKGEVHINEPQISEMVKTALQANKLSLSNTPVNADIHFITVPTPISYLKNKDPEPDITFVIDAAKAISRIIKKNDLVIIESTCPVGTTQKISEVISVHGNISRNDFHIAYCPERVLPGDIVNEIKTIIGHWWQFRKS